MKIQKDEPCDVTWDQHGAGTCENCKTSWYAHLLSLYDPGCPAYQAPTPVAQYTQEDNPCDFRKVTTAAGEDYECRDCGRVVDQSDYEFYICSPGAWDQCGAAKKYKNKVTTTAIKPRGKYGNCHTCDRELSPYLDATYDRDLEGHCSKCQVSRKKYLDGLRRGLS